MDLKQVIQQYDPNTPLELAVTPPSAWYTDQQFAKHELKSVFGGNWLVAARVEQLKASGDYVAVDIAGQPVLVVKDKDIKAFYNVCRHHAAQVQPTGQGCTKALTCPYHGWNYRLDGSLASTPQFEGACEFNKADNSLVPIRCEVWQHWVFVCLDQNQVSLSEFLGELTHSLDDQKNQNMQFYHRVEYQLDCNWKVYVDNYLDGGYHVPVLHKGLNSALDFRHYKIENVDRHCLQSCPTRPGDNDFAKVRSGLARYYWQYPNLMLNLYEGIMGIILVEPISVDSCKVVFEYYFDEDNPKISEEFKAHSVTASDKIQDEDVEICLSVQKGLNSNAYDTGRLSPAREAGEHLFHRLLYQDLFRGLT